MQSWSKKWWCYKDSYNAKIKDIEDKIPDITNLVSTTTLNAKINVVKNEIPSIINLVTSNTVNAKINEIKNKIPNITNLATSTAFTAVEYKTLDHIKCITTPEFDKLTAETFAARLALANLASKSYIANYVKETDFNDQLKYLNIKKLLSRKHSMYLLKMNLKNYTHLNQVFLLVKVTLIMMEHNFI